MVSIIKQNDLKKELNNFDLIINMTDKNYEVDKVYQIPNMLMLYKFILKEDVNNKNIGIIYKNKKVAFDYKYLITFLLFYKKYFKELQDNQDKINVSLKNTSDNKIVKDIINDFCDLNKDGKYIRGILIALGEYLAKGKEKLDYLNLAYAYEMFQTSVLIHDDIIDNAKVRRGKKTIPLRIYEKLSNKKNKDDIKTLGNSIGICAGDFGFYEANKLLIKSYSNHKNFSKLMEVYNDIIIKTIKGEIIDVYLPVIGKYKIDTPTEKDILDIYHLKTSWYTIIGPFTLGYILGGKKISKELESTLNKIGISFQLKDDILGIFADSKIIGKSNVSDIEEFKQTILYSHIINTNYKNKFLKIYGKKKIKEKDLLKVRNLLIKAGSYEYAVKYLDKIYRECLKEIDYLNISIEGKDILKGLLIYINIREK